MADLILELSGICCRWEEVEAEAVTPELQIMELMKNKTISLTGKVRKLIVLLDPQELSNHRRFN